jgi:hypothetical protein
MNPFICLIRPAQHRVYSTPSDKKGLRHEPPPASQDRPRIVFDCRTANDPAMIPLMILHRLPACARRSRG